MSDAPRPDGAESAIALVTGATEGIGYHTARGLAAAGRTVLITGRDSARGEQAASSIASATGARVRFIQVDHSTVGANRQFTQALGEQLQQSGGKLDILINNVGAIFAHRTVTPDGYETALAVNFLAPYVDNLDGGGNYIGIEAYGRTSSCSRRGRWACPPISATAGSP